jgi:LmbE family N-acetylglucosaminyl deacetylase
MATDAASNRLRPLALRERRLIETAELQGDQLLVRRPHYQLRGNDLFWLGSDKPCRQFSEAQARLWSLAQHPVPLSEVRRACGEGADNLMREFLQSELCDLLEPAFPQNRRRVLVIEPHADDAALSIGGTIWTRRHDHCFLIATMASRGNHTRYRDLGCDFFDVSEVTEIRRLESELFARLVGGTAIPVGLTDSELRYHDANWTFDFFRQHRMSIRVSTARIADSRERQRWTDAVKRLLTEHPSDEVWFPLGARHTDHLLTADACYAVFLANPSLIAGRTLRVYGEFPYTARYPQQIKDSLNALEKSGAMLDAMPAPIANVADQKRHLASVYDSQDISEMLRGTRSSADAHGRAAGRAEKIWTLRGLPKQINPSGILSAATTEPALVQAAAAWAQRNRGAAIVRVLLLMPTGRWASDIEMLFAAFPHARFEMYVATTAAAEVASVTSDRIDVRIIASGSLAWIFQSLRISFAMQARPTLFHVGERRQWQARLLSRLWPGSDTLMVESMNQLVSALQVNP